MIEVTPFAERSDSTLPFLSPPDDDLPELYEDEGQGEMGDSAPHTDTNDILLCSLRAHLADRPSYHVFSDLNLHYHPTKPQPYVSPDIMIVEPHTHLEAATSYRMGRDGPAPVLAVEVLSPRTAQQGDLEVKPRIYSRIGVLEYILVDTSGRFMEQRLLIRKRQPNGEWVDSQDEDGGVTSVLGFRIILEDDGSVRLLNATTGEAYTKPEEAQAETQARRAAERASLRSERARDRSEQARNTEQRARLTAEADKKEEQRARLTAEADKKKAERAQSDAEKARLKAEDAMNRSDERNRELEIELARLRRLLPPG